MQRYRGIVAYDGTEFSGWQIQPNGLSVQECIERGIARITGETPKVHGSGRTDAGVHARAQVFHFDLGAPAEPSRLLRGLNAVLPSAIRCSSIRPVDGAFHARKSAVSKEYRYFIWNHPIADPFRLRYALHHPASLDVPAMRLAAAALIGARDFAAFSGNPHRLVESTVRNVSILEVRKRGGEVCIRAAADGFLYKMVRSLAGFLIRVGSGDLTLDAAAAILESRARTAAVPTAPPQGLFLWKVFYSTAGPAPAKPPVAQG